MRSDPEPVGGQPGTDQPVPLISVIIPAYQCAATLARALDSALAQDYPALEILVTDDGSTDDTPRILARYAAADARLRCLRQANQGAGSARNTAIAHAVGEYLAFLDDDDEWRPAKLRRQAAILARHPEIGLVFTDGEEVNLGRGTVELRSRRYAGDLRALGLEPTDGAESAFRASGDVRRVLLENNNCIMTTSVMVRAEVCRRAGNFGVGPYMLEDLDLWLRAAGLCQFAYCAEPLAVHHRHAANFSGLSEAWLTRLIAYQRGFLPAPAYAGLRGPVRRGLRRRYRDLIFYYGRRGQPRQALAAFRRSLEAGYDGLSALCALGSWLGPWPFRLVGRLLWP